MAEHHHHTQDAELLDRLEKLARAATPGPWRLVDNGWIDGAAADEYVVQYEGCGSHAAEWDENDLQFVLAANPAVVLHLVAMARRSIPQGDEPAKAVQGDAGSIDRQLTGAPEAVKQGDELPPLPERDGDWAGDDWWSADSMREYGAACRAGSEEDACDAARYRWLEDMGNKPEGLLLHDGGDFTGRCGLGLRRIGRTLRQAVDAAMGKQEKR